MSATLELESRESLTKGQLKDLRKAGHIPCVIYGDNAEPISATIERRLLEQVYRRDELGRNALISLTVNGNSIQVISKDWQRHPITNQIEHVDFLRINDRKRLTVNIPVKMLGTAIGTKKGGILIRQMTWLKVECLPSELIPRMELDVTGLDIGDSIRIKDLSLEGSMQVLNPKDSILASVEAKRAEKIAVTELAEGEEGEGAEGEDGEAKSEGAASDNNEGE